MRNRGAAVGSFFLGSKDGGFDNADEDVLALFAQQAATEEVEIAVPGGKSVRALIDATPVRAADGTVERPVVALRDRAPFEARERARAEFPGMVSHELRAPLAAIRGSAATTPTTRSTSSANAARGITSRSRATAEQARRRLPRGVDWSREDARTSGHAAGPRSKARWRLLPARSR